jgi:hypothetical protein
LDSAHRSAASLAAATIINLPFGTLYAFSVLLKPVEALIGATRGEMSLVFGLTTVTLTAGMNLAPRLYRRLSPATLAIACALSSGAGLWLAGSATGIVQFAIGYALLFGPGAGVLFNVSQQAVNQTVTRFARACQRIRGQPVPAGAMLGSAASRLVDRGVRRATGAVWPRGCHA